MYFLTTRIGWCVSWGETKCFGSSQVKVSWRGWKGRLGRATWAMAPMK
jgi:hypothetical protein